MLPTGFLLLLQTNHGMGFQSSAVQNCIASQVLWVGGPEEARLHSFTMCWEVATEVLRVCFPADACGLLSVPYLQRESAV